MRRMKLAVVLALALMLLAAVPVSAAKPVVIDWVYEDDNVWSAAPCPGFDVWDHEVLNVRTTLFYDDEGNLLREISLLKGTNTLYTLENPGVELVGETAITIHYNYVTGTGYGTGLISNLTIPGYGTVFVQAGRWDQNLYPVYPDSHLAGKDSFGDPEDIEQLCSYLAAK